MRNITLYIRLSEQFGIVGNNQATSKIKRALLFKRKPSEESSFDGVVCIKRNNLEISERQFVEISLNAILRNANGGNFKPDSMFNKMSIEAERIHVQIIIFIQQSDAETRI